ncbi:hypothetical protein IQ243_17180 [Nostocales cyanobacterium LEGE 11386]|nr:hypothetical protein [Nostocales cyanobacterium LEGE 11386]
MKKGAKEKQAISLTTNIEAVLLIQIQNNSFGIDKALSPVEVYVKNIIYC